MRYAPNKVEQRERKEQESRKLTETEQKKEINLILQLVKVAHGNKLSFVLYFVILLKILLSSFVVFVQLCFDLFHFTFEVAEANTC